MAGRLRHRALLASVLLAGGLGAPPAEAAVPLVNVQQAGWKADPAGVRVVAFSPGTHKLVVASARGAVQGGLETTSALCRHHRCVAGVNGDFFAGGAPIGALVVNCLLLHTPQKPHEHVGLDLRSVGGPMDWSGRVVLPRVATSTVAVSLPVRAVNPRHTGDGVSVYLPQLGTRTPLGSGVVDHRFVVLPGQPRAGRLGRTTRMRLHSVRAGGGAPVTAGTVVLSTRGPDPLRLVRRGQVVALRLDAASGCNVVGGRPVLLRAGRAVPLDPRDAAMRSPAPRTVVAWRRGRTFLVTFDGRRPGNPGATMAEVTRFLRQRLRATDAVNLDGGGSTTFVVRGRVLNRPSDGRERPVSNALLVLPRR